MAKSICENCGAPFDQTPGKREKKFCKSSCRVSHCQKMKRLKSRITSVLSDKVSFNGKKVDLHNMDEVGQVDTSGESVQVKKASKKNPVKKVFKAPTDKHGAGKIVKEAVQKKEVTIKEVVSSYLDQRRKQKLGK